MQEPYRLVFEKNPHPMLVFDTETLAFLAVNDAAVRHYGYTRDEFLGMTACQIRPPEDVARFLVHLGNLGPDQYSSNAWRHVRKDGSVIFVDVTSSPLSFEGRPARLVLVTDTSERKRMEISVRESEARLRTYLESASEGIIAVDRGGRIEFANARVEEIFGYQRGELIGRPMEILLPERYRGAHTGYRARYAENPRLRPMGTGLSLTALRKDGSEFPVEVGLSAVPVEDGFVQIGFINDITARKQAEDALRQSEQRLRALIESTSDWVWEVDENGVYTYVSPQVRVVLGYEPEEVLGKAAFDLMPGDEAHRAREFFRRISAEARPFQHFENVALHKSGRPVVLETNGVPWFDKHEIGRASCRERV